MFEPYYRELLGFLSGKVRDRATAADLVQESYVRVYAAQQTGPAVRDPRALLYRIARNLVTDHWRHQEVRAVVEAVATDTLASEGSFADAHPAPAATQPDEILASRQGVLALAAAIDALPPRCREAFMLNRFEDLSYAQVAERMDISVKMVELHMRQALEACDRCRTMSSGELLQASPTRRKLPRSRLR